MTVTIYADTLVFLNTFVTYFLLMSTLLICRRSPRKVRVLVSSLIGGLYSLTILLDSIPYMLSFALRLIVCILLFVIAEGVRIKCVMLKEVFVFLMMNCLYAGLMMLCRMFIPQLLFSRGIAYLDVSIPFLLCCTLAAYLCIRLIARLFTARPSRSHVGSVTIYVEDRSVSGNGVFDTGNHLIDGFTGKPVLIVRPSLLRPILPPGVADYLEGKQMQMCDIPDAWRGRLRLFPYSGLSGEGLLPAFRCDRAVLTHLNSSCTKEKLYIAAAPRQLYHGETDVLFPAALYEEITEGEYGHDLQKNCADFPRRHLAASFKKRFLSALHQRTANAACSAETSGRGRCFGTPRFRR